MIPNEVYNLACAVGNTENPTEKHITEAWRVYNALEARGYRVTPQ